MENIKYTEDGKKVAVVGKINNTQWIVQEIYVSGDNEFPAGESFVVTSLLDSPAETYHSRREKDLKEEIKKLENKADEIRKDLKIMSIKERSAKHINMILNEYDSIDIEQLDTFLSFISGNITHIVSENYRGFEIVSFLDALKKEDSWGSNVRYEGLKLLSLFGCSEKGKRYDDKGFSLNWRINHYRDGSGGWTNVFPAKSYEEALEIVATKLKIKMEEFSSKGFGCHGNLKECIDCANKYKISVDSKYLNELKFFNKTNAEELVEKAEQELLKAKEDLKSLRLLGYLFLW